MSRLRPQHSLVAVLLLLVSGALAPTAAAAGEASRPAASRPSCVGDACPWGAGGWLTSPDGFVTRWTLWPRVKRIGRLFKNRMALDEALERARRRRPKVHHEVGPVLARWDRKPHGDHLLRARVYSPDAREVLLKPALTGRLRLYVNGARVAALDDRDYLLLDDHRVKATLKAGWNTVTAAVAPYGRHAPRFALRVRAADEGLANDLVWTADEDSDAPPAGAPCSALSASIEVALGPQGWLATGRVEAPGLLPRAVGRSLLTLRASRRESPQPTALGELLAGRPATATLQLPNSRRGRPQVQLLVDGQVCAERRVMVRPRYDKRVHALREALAGLRSAGQLTPGALASLEHQVQHATRIAAGDDDTKYLGLIVDELEGLLARAATAADPFRDQTGVFVRAYRSELDGRLQRYSVHVPRRYARRPDRRWPLVVAFHGKGFLPEDTLRIVSGKVTWPTGGIRRSTRKNRDLRDLGAIIVAPRGYGDGGHRGVGERDVLRVIEEVSASWRVDPRRVSITGFSLGGTVSFVMPLRYPDRFAAAAPLCGYPNLRSFSTIGGRPRRPWEESLIRQKAIFFAAENGRHVPLHVAHGGEDNPNRSKMMVDRYRQLGQRVRYDLMPGEGHSIWDDAYASGRVVRWLARQKIPEHPRHVRLRTGHYRYVESHWLRLDRFADAQALASLDGHRRRDRVDIKTTNVAAFTLRADRLQAAPRALDLVVDGLRVGSVGATADPVYVSRRGGAWQIVAGRDLPPGHKRAGLSGPLDDAWMEPFVIVYGASDPAQLDANRLTAESLANYDWFRSDLSVPILPDHAVNAADLRGRGVVLVGNPRSNRWTRAAVERLPVAFEPDAIVFGGRRFAGPEVGISFIHPSPFDPDHYVVVHAGVTGEGTLSSRNLPGIVPDFLVYDRRMRDQFWARLLDRREVLAGGFFGPSWEPPDL